MKPFLSVLIFFLAHHAFAQNHYTPAFGKEFYESVANKTDSLFTDYGYSAPGSAVVVIHDGNIILNKGYGLASLENEIAITPQTVFDLASISKMFTGYAIGSLLHEKRISIDDNIRKYIPELPDYGNPITIDQLVHHTSGLKNWTEFIPVAGFSFDDVISTKQVLMLTWRQKQLNFIPGSKYEYCNTGYVLLAEVVQRVTGMSFKAWCKKNMFDPLAMTSTTILDDHTLSIPSKATSYFTGKDGQWHRSPESCSVSGSSSVHSNANDLARWLMFLDQPGDKKNIVDLMFQSGKLNTGQTIDYGLGVILREFKNTAVRRHEGFWPSYSTFLFFYPELHLSIAVLNNSPLQSYKSINEIASMFISNENETKDLSSVAIREPAHEISPDLFKTFAGVYRSGPGWYLTITANQSTLTAQPSNDDPYPMIALSDTTFNIPEFRQDVIFRNYPGKGISLQFMGKRLLKVSPRHLEIGELKTLIGNYCNEELQACYSVTLEKTKLRLQHPHLGILELMPALNFDFIISGAERWFPAALEFGVNSNGVAESFLLGGYSFRKQN